VELQGKEVKFVTSGGNGDFYYMKLSQQREG